MPNHERLAKRVLLVGWDAADWKLINKYMDEGAMPFMKQFLERGSHGNIATLQPVLSPMLWNSIATGKRSYKHGIHGFTEPMPDGKGVRPSSSTTRKCKALWNICTQAGMKANVVSWFVSHPAEPINGVCVSEMFRTVPIDKKAPQDTTLPVIPPKSVFPESMREEMFDLRLHPGELTEEEILPFIPNAAKINQSKDARLTTFAKLFSEMINTHNAATHLMETTEWDFMGVYYDAIDHFGHGFMEYHPPRMEHVSEEDFEIYQDVIAGVYKFHDLILGRLLNLAGEDTTIVLCSDHGYHSDHLRPKELPNEPAAPAIWHRDYGVIAMAGPGVKSGVEILGATLLDVAPTILSLLGLPVGEDMDGKVLTHVIADRWGKAPDPIPSWEDVPGESGMHPKGQQEDPFAAREALKQLVELGYIEEPDPDAEKAARNAAREATFNVARSYMEGGLFDEAAERLEELYEAEPDQPRFGVSLIRAYMRLRRFDEVRPLAERLFSEMEKTNQRKADWFDEAIRTIDEKPDEIIANAYERIEKAHAKRVESERAKAEEEGREPIELERPTVTISEEHLTNRKRILQNAVESLRGFDIHAIPTVNMLLGRLEALDGNYDKALEHLAKAEKAEPRLPGLHLQLGQTYLRMRQNEESVRAFQKALDIDPDNAQAHEGLGTALTRLHRHEEAVDHALRAVELLHELPSAHLRLGVTLARLNYFQQAAEAFETCLKLAPLTPAAHRWLSTLYQDKLQRPDQAYGHRQRLKEVLQELKEGRKQDESIAEVDSADMEIPADIGSFQSTGSSELHAADPGDIITIVTGLPRTGTSMMMQMLVAGGIEPLTDGKREADASNPKGYFEHEKATQLRTESSWLGEGRGKVVKIIAQLLPALPFEIDGNAALYRLVFMERNLDEVLASQRTMLTLQGRKGADLERSKLAEVFEDQLRNVLDFIRERNIACHVVRHAEVIEDPNQVAQGLDDFFGGVLNIEAMVAVVDPSLHREKTSP